MAALPTTHARPKGLYWLLAFGVLAFSSSPILVRYASEGPGLAVAMWRTVFAVLLLAPFALPRIGPDVRKFSRKDWGFIGLAGVFLSLHFISWIESLYHTSVASAATLVATNPIFLAIFGFLLLKERLQWQTVVAIGIAVFGTILLNYGDAGDTHFPNALWGNALSLFAALVVTGYFLIGRVVRQKVSWLAYVFPLYTLVAVIVSSVAWLAGTTVWGYSPSFYMVCGAMALFPQILGHGSFNYAIKFMPAALLGLLSLGEPIGAAIFAYFVFKETPSLLGLMGLLTLLGAIGLALLTRRPDPPDAT